MSALEDFERLTALDAREVHAQVLAQFPHTDGAGVIPGGTWSITRWPRR